MMSGTLYQCYGAWHLPTSVMFVTKHEIFQHKGVPYCHVPCYGALFGPQLFGHGTRVESHTSFGKVENRSGTPNLPR